MRLWYRFMNLAWRESTEGWDEDVLREICPAEGEKFEDWLKNTADYMEPLEGAVTPWGPVKEAIEILKESDDPDDSFRFVFTADLRAPKTHVVQQFARLLDAAIEDVSLPPRRAGRPTGIGTNWVNYAPNGQVDVSALEKAIDVFEARRSARAEGRKITNVDLWNDVVLAKQPEGRQRIADQVDPDVKASEVSRHLKRARDVMDGVRRGRFPFHDRERSQGLRMTG